MWGKRVVTACPSILHDYVFPTFISTTSPLAARLPLRIALPLGGSALAAGAARSWLCPRHVRLFLSPKTCNVSHAAFSLPCTYPSISIVGPQLPVS